MLLVRVVNDQTGEVWNAELPDKDFLLVACTWTQAHQRLTQALSDQNRVMRFRRAGTLADQALTALGDMPLLVLKDVPEKAEARANAEQAGRPLNADFVADHPELAKKLLAQRNEQPTAQQETK